MSKSDNSKEGINNSRESANQPLSVFMQSGLMFDEIALYLKKIKWFRSMIEIIDQNFFCHSFNEVEDTALLFIRKRCPVSVTIEVFENIRNLSYWNKPIADEIAKGFVDRLYNEKERYKKNQIEKIKEMGIRKTILYYYEEALFILNYVFRQSSNKRKEYATIYKQ